MKKIWDLVHRFLSDSRWLMSINSLRSMLDLWALLRDVATVDDLASTPRSDEARQVARMIDYDDLEGGQVWINDESRDVQTSNNQREYKRSVLWTEVGLLCCSVSSWWEVILIEMEWSKNSFRTLVATFAFDSCSKSSWCNKYFTLESYRESVFRAYSKYSRGTVYYLQMSFIYVYLCICVYSNHLIHWECIVH